MKLEYSKIDKHLTGIYKLIPEIIEDIWYLYNILSIGDIIKSSTYRKVQKSNNELEIEQVIVDLEQGCLRVSGKNVIENENLKLGQHHTIELLLNKSFEIYKKEWDVIYTDIITQACDPTVNAEIAIVALHAGFCNVCLISHQMTIVKAKIEVALPKKRAGSSQHDKAKIRFYDQIMEAIIKHVDFNIIKVLVIASPAFFKEELYEYICGQAVKKDIKELRQENRAKIVLTHCASGHKHAIKEILADPSVSNKIENTQSMDEVKELDRFLRTLDADPDKAFYGLTHVKLACDNNAIETLFITDGLFRSSDVETRKLYIALVEKVKANEGEVRIFSTLHVSGEQLSQMTGIAAILRFPMPDIDLVVDNSIAQAMERRNSELKELKLERRNN